MATQVGIQRDSAMQQHIDNCRPPGRLRRTASASIEPGRAIGRFSENKKGRASGISAPGPFRRGRIATAHSSSMPARDLAQRSTIFCWTLGGTGSYDLNSIVYEPWPAVMLFRSVA